MRTRPLSHAGPFLHTRPPFPPNPQTRPRHTKSVHITLFAWKYSVALCRTENTKNTNLGGLAQVVIGKMRMAKKKVSELVKRGRRKGGRRGGKQISRSNLSAAPDPSSALPSPPPQALEPNLMLAIVVRVFRATLKRQTRLNSPVEVWDFGIRDCGLGIRRSGPEGLEGFWEGNLAGFGRVIWEGYFGRREEEVNIQGGY